MSQLQQPASQENQREIENLLEEISFQKVLLASIDDGVHDREAAENEIRQEIRSIERQVKNLRRGIKAAPSSQISVPSSPQPGTSRAAAQKSNPEAAMGINDSEPWRPITTQSSTASTPNSAGSLLLSPSQMNLPTRKRSHIDHLDGTLDFDESANKSRRTSPSPYITGPTTPSTGSSGDDEFDAFDRDFFNKKQDEELARLRREKLDEDFARQIQTQADDSDISSVPLPMAGYNAFDRISGVRPSQQPSSFASLSSNHIPATSSSNRNLPWANSQHNMHSGVSVKAEPRTMTSGFVKREREESSGSGMAFSAYASSPSRISAIKNEVKNAPSFSMPGAFRDDPSGDSDSDIEIIPSSAFHDNGRHPRLPVVAHGVQAKTEEANASALQMAMYGKNAAPKSWMSSSAANSPTLSSPQDLNNPLSDLIRRSGGNNYDDLRDHLNIGDDEDMNERLEYIMNDPRNSHDDLKSLLENIRPDVELPPEAREGTPEGMVYPLYEHQKLALTWLKAMEDGSNKGGILADDMGLGKTISTLALLLSRPSPDRARKTTLIVGPVALVRQWMREIKQKVKVGHRLSTYMVHGQNKKLSWTELQNYDIVLTTYGTLGAEFSRLCAFKEKHKGNPYYDTAPMKQDFPLLGPASKWYRVVLDEAQCIKNKSTKTAKAAYALIAKFRFCLTGTPMMNSIDELYSLINFLKIKPYNDWTRFRADFGCLTKNTGKARRNEHHIKSSMQKLQVVLKSILLRRVKTSLIDGKPIIVLPPKTEEIQHVVFDEDEQAFYTALETKTQIQFNKYLKANTVGKHYSNILVLLLRLRQACCHPHLIHDFAEPLPAGAGADAMMELAKTLSPEVVARLLAADDAFECPVCYDAVQNPKIVIPCGHDTCAECLTKITDQAAQQNVADGNEGGATSKCPSCRGDLNLNQIIDYTAFRKVHKPLPGDDGADDDETASDTDGDSETESDLGSYDETDDDGDLRDFVVPDDIEDSTASEAEEDETEEVDAGEAQRQSTPKPKAKPKGKDKESKRRRKVRRGKKKEKTAISMAMLKKESIRNHAAHRRYMRYLRKNWQPSAKITKCVELLAEFQQEDRKTIIFSQFVSLLDLLEVPIQDNNWNCLRYDGAMSADARNDAINTFTDDPNHKIMLISLKAGNAGLNLTAASRVIILDPFWNPFIEMQAVDRAYRIGQQNEVQVHRILIEKTVEDRIIQLQEQKKALVEAALDEGANKSLGRLDVRQLAFLFGVPA